MTNNLICLCWLGHDDLRYANTIQKNVGSVSEYIKFNDTKIEEYDLKNIEFLGPINAFMGHMNTDLTHLYVLCPNYPEKNGISGRTSLFSILDVEKYRQCMQRKYGSKIIFRKVNLNQNEVANYEKIYNVVINELETIKNIHNNCQLMFHTSPGTSQMSAIWLLLSKTNYPAKLFQSYYDKNANKQVVIESYVPFNIKLDYIVPKTDKIIKHEWANLEPYQQILHKSDLMKDILDDVFEIAIHDVNVLVLGESGTGKELIAKAIHASSSRKGKVFKSINCSAISPELIESEFFGHEKGSFTGAVDNHIGIFEYANNGTIFLDEVGDLSLSAQAKLLRAIGNDGRGTINRIGSEKEIYVDVRIIAATNKDIIGMVQNGKFREDLYFRLCVGLIRLPALKERKDDVLHLANKFLEDYSIKQSKIHNCGSKIISKRFDKSAEEFLLSYRWPGNIRELQNVIQRICIWHKENIINKATFEKHIVKIDNHDHLNTSHIVLPIDLEEKLNELRRVYFERALEDCHGNMTKAAKKLNFLSGKSQNKFKHWMDKLGITNKWK